MTTVFVDFIDWDYDPETPLRRPLGGTQSAVCHLAVALAARGEPVALVNRGRTEHVARGVACLPMTLDAGGFTVTPAGDAWLGAPGARVIVCGFPLAQAVRPHLARDARLFLWTQHAVDQPVMQPLADPAVRDGWDGFLFVSDWQRRGYAARFDIPAERSRILRNAAAPGFALLAASDDPCLDAPRPPALAYTSTPYRGLDLLLDVFPEIRRACPEVTLTLYSSMAVYNVAGAEDGFAPLYERARRMAGVEHVGSVPQPDLATALSGTAVLAYPSTFAETSCIAVIEALAAGCAVVTSDLGALPETAAGHARLVPVDRLRDDFAAAVVDALVSAAASGAEASARRRERRRAQRDATWAARAAALPTLL